MKSAKFSIEIYGNEIFDGFTRGEDWNGWDCPYFNFEQANKILENYNQLSKITGRSERAVYDVRSDSFIFPGADGEDE